jgi:hypothetical protein
MEALIIGGIIAIVLLIAAPYMIWSAIILIPRLLWACSKAMTVLILLVVFGYGVSMIVEYKDTEVDTKIEKETEKSPQSIKNYNEDFYKNH